MLNLGNVKDLTSLNKQDSTPWYLSPSFLLAGIFPSYVSDFANNRYYSSTVGPRAFPYTFTRASNATHFDSQGRMVWAEANMLRHSDDPTNAVWSKTDSTISSAGETSPSGAASTLVTEGTSGTAILQQSLTGLGVNSPLCYSAEVKRGNSDWIRMYLGAGANDVRVWFNLATGVVGTTQLNGAALAPGSAAIADLGNGYYRCTIVAEDINSATVNAFTGSASGDLSNTRVNNHTRIIGRQQVEMFGPDSPKTNLIQTTTTAYYAPRFDYDPVTLTRRGILVEETDINLCNVTGEQWDNMPAVTGGFLVPNPTATMFGRRASVYQGGGTGGVQYFVPFGTTSSIPPASTEHTISVFVRAGSRTKCQITPSSAFAPATAYANFDLSAGTILAQGAGAYNVTIQPFGDNGVYRLSLTFTTIAVPANGAAVVVAFIDSDLSGRLPSITVGNSNTLVVFGAQLQFGPWASSFIPCYSTVVTRIRDDMSEATGSWFDATKGTFYVNFMRQYVAPALGSGPAGTMLQVSNGTNNERYSIVCGAGTNAQHRFDVLTGGTPVAQIAPVPTGVALVPFKLTALYALNNFKILENGGSVTTLGTGTLPTGINIVYPGWTGTGAHLNGWISDLRYYPDNSATEAQLQALTT